MIPWRREEMVLAVAPDHPLARRRRRRLRPQELNGADFISFDEDLPIRRHMDRFLKEHGVEVNIALHFDNIQMIKEAVTHRVGVSIMPARIMQDDIEQGRLAAVRIADATLFRPLGIIHRKKKRFHRVAQAFLDLLREGSGPEAVGGVDGASPSHSGRFIFFATAAQRGLGHKVWAKRTKTPACGIVLLDVLLKPTRRLIRLSTCQVEPEEYERGPIFVAFPKLLKHLFRPSGISGALEHPCEGARTSGVPRRQGIRSFRVFQSLREFSSPSAQQAHHLRSREEVLVDLQNLAIFGLGFRESPRSEQ